MASEEETNPSLPPYPEMILDAIKALDDKAGSTKTAISKHIESQHGDLPAGHATLLAHHLSKMKSNADLLLLPNDIYKLPDPNTPSKRGRGRSPKPKTPQSPGSTTPRPRGRPPKAKDPAQVSAAKAAAGLPKRGRGRPPKNAGDAAAPAGSPASASAKKGRGRPPKVKPEDAATAVASD